MVLLRVDWDAVLDPEGWDDCVVGGGEELAEVEDDCAVARTANISRVSTLRRAVAVLLMMGGLLLPWSRWCKGRGKTDEP